MKRSLIGFVLLPLFLTACADVGGGAASLDTTHVHGLAVDRADTNRVYIATHNGLLVWQEGQGLSHVGGSRDDFMGFSAHPTDPKIFFRSGHPAGGGNLGFQKSTDTGATWDTVANGSPTGPADFHTMMVHPADPEHIYGWFGGRIHRSFDGGETWTVLPDQMNITSIAGDPLSAITVFAGTPNGLLVSTDQGGTWAQMTTERSLGAVLDIEPDVTTASLLLALQDGKIVRLSRNPEGGWAMQELGILPDRAMHLALDPKNARTMYAFTKGHSLYMSIDGGQNWQKLL